jgi:hypothetical protein
MKRTPTKHTPMKQMLIVYALVASSLLSTPAFAKMQEKPVEWMLGKQAFSGVLVYDDASSAKRPGLLMVPDWKGVTADATARGCARGTMPRRWRR